MSRRGAPKPTPAIRVKLDVVVVFNRRLESIAFGDPDDIKALSEALTEHFKAKDPTVIGAKVVGADIGLDSRFENCTLPGEEELPKPEKKVRRGGPTVRSVRLKTAPPPKEWGRM